MLELYETWVELPPMVAHKTLSRLESVSFVPFSCDSSDGKVESSPGGTAACSGASMQLRDRALLPHKDIQPVPSRLTHLQWLKVRYPHRPLVKQRTGAPSAADNSKGSEVALSEWLNIYSRHAHGRSSL